MRDCYGFFGIQLLLKCAACLMLTGMAAGSQLCSYEKWKKKLSEVPMVAVNLDDATMINPACIAQTVN